ncbi:amidohydrolase family protein [Deinococcus sp.]|uniref:amidohydrolase family protein n=1 Tax=Deinococcus sp. TaxID=47478 RepID=UPI002869BCFB|nr:amidohydrolase family protein [Deinococcus sp.]
MTGGGTNAQTIVDTHVHCWNPRQIEYFWLDSADESLRRVVTLAELEPQRLAAGVAWAVFVQASHDVRELPWVLEELNAFPWVRGVVGWIDLTAPSGLEAAQGALLDPRLCGVRHLTHDIPEGDWLARDDVNAALAAMPGLKLSVDLVLRPQQLPLAAEVVADHPTLTVVLDHLGNPPLADGDLHAWSHDLAALAALPNVSAKVSGLLTLLRPGQDRAPLRQAVAHAFDVFGPERLMYGGDWPVSTQSAHYQTTLDTLRSALPPLNTVQAQAFWAGTADRIYRLGLFPNTHQEVQK